jgi:hypothetical protein
VHRTPRPFTSRFGLPPGRTACRFAEAEGGCVGSGGLRDGLQESCGSLAQWLAARRPCLECEALATCGGCLATGDGAPCHPAARALVERIALAGAAIATEIGPRGR